MTQPSPKAAAANPEPTDAELMGAVRGGDTGAFTLLVDRHKDALVNYLTRLSGCRERAQDLAQDAFLRLYEQAGRYDERGLLKAFLYRIATNLLRSEQRREKRFRLLQPFLGTGESQRPEAPGKVLGEEARFELTRAVAELPLRYRIPLVLHEIEGWSYTDIALQLGCREGTVKSRIHRARRRLKERLAPYWLGRRSNPKEEWAGREQWNGETP